MDFEARQRSCKSRLPFRCKHCTRCFSRMNELQIHNKLHKKRRPANLKDIALKSQSTDRQPIPKLVIRRNSSPVKRDGKSYEIENYEIVDLTEDETETKNNMIGFETEKENDKSHSPPFQKDSGIDDCSPQSSEDVVDSTKNTPMDHIYSPCIDVNQASALSPNTYSNEAKCSSTLSPSANTDTVGIHSREETLPDSTTSDPSSPCVTLQLPTLEQIKAQSNSSGFITIDIDHLKQIVELGTLADSKGNIEVTLGPSDETRNIFDAISSSKSVVSPSVGDYVPSPKKPRRSYDFDNDFDTGDSQFNFYDSNQVNAPVDAVNERNSDSESVSIGEADVSDQESSSHNNSTESVFASEFVSLASSQKSNGPSKEIDDRQRKCLSMSPKDNAQISSSTKSPDSAILGAENCNNSTQQKQECNNNRSQIISQSSILNSDVTHPRTLSLLKNTSNDSSTLRTKNCSTNAVDTRLCDQFITTQTESAIKSPRKIIKECPRKSLTKFDTNLSVLKNSNLESSLLKSDVIYVDNSDVETQLYSPGPSTKQADQSVSSEPKPSSDSINKHSNSSEKHCHASKYQSEFAKFLQQSSNDSSQTNNIECDHNFPIHSDPIANIFESFDYALSCKSKKRVKIKSEDWDTEEIRTDIDEVRNTSHETILRDTRHDEVHVQEQSPTESLPKGPWHSRRQIKSYCTSMERLESLRKQVVCLLHVLFPRLEYPAYFNSGSLCVEVLLDQIIFFLRTNSKKGVVTCPQSIPLENSCCNVRVLLCPKSPKACLVNLRKKICKFLEQVLPQLHLAPAFQRTGENVDELLYQVIESNTPR